MNDLISKWNKEIKHIEQEVGELADIKEYINKKKKVTIIDLKQLNTLDKNDLINEIENILVDYIEILKGNYVNMPPDLYYPCLYYLSVIDKNKCEEFTRCFLCKLDYLLDINRIKITKKV